MRKIKILIIVAIILVLIIGTYFGYSYLKPKPVNKPSSTNQPIVSSTQNQVPQEKFVITKENLPSVIKNQEFVKSLPSNGVLMLKLYNFNSGERQWEESYVIKKNEVYMGSVDNPDISIVLDSRYVSELSNFCSALQKAKENNQLGSETKMSSAALLLKYRSMLKFKNCLGM